MNMISYMQPNPGPSTGHLPAQGGSVPATGGIADRDDEAVVAEKYAQLKKACSDFESIFIYSMLKSMRRSMPENGLFDNSHDQKVYKAMADQAMAENIARQGGMGLGKVLYQQLKGATAKVDLDRNRQGIL